MANIAKQTKDFLVSVADVAFFDGNGQLVFTGKTALNTTFSVSTEDQEITGGKGDKVLYKYKYGRKVSATIEMAEWNLAYIAANIGTSIFEGLKDAYSVAECVTLTNGVGTLKHTPVGKVFVEVPGQQIQEITPVGSTITVGTDNGQVYATYQYNTQLKRVTVDADSTPMVGRLVLDADKHNNGKGKIADVQIEVPSFQLNGTFDISMESGGTTTTQMDGDALAVQGDSCSDGQVYSYISEIPSEASTISINQLVAKPNKVSLAVGESTNVSLIGTRSVPYSNVSVEVSEVTFTSADADKATVSAAGVITAVAAGEVDINVVYKADETKTDVIKVTVTGA